jgi:hypothetical protein
MRSSYTVTILRRGTESLEVAKHMWAAILLLASKMGLGTLTAGALVPSGGA